VVDIFDEVSEDLRAEKAQQLLKRYGGLLVLAAVLVLVAVAGWQAWRWRQTQQTNLVASAYIEAMRNTAGPPAADGATPSRDKALQQFDTLAATAPEGYRTLARLRAAALRAAAGDVPGALTLWDQISADTAADPLLRDVANLMWVQHQVDQGDPAAVEGRLAPLVAQGNPWRPLAMEEQALLMMRTGQDAKARDILKQLQTDASAPDGVRARASGLLTRLGTAPAAALGAGG
jgi:hypothetical protein